MNKQSMNQQGFFLQSKIQIPVVPESFVVRERLIHELENCRQKLVILHAAAGYGKTVLLAHYARTARQQCIWCHLDRVDNDATIFMQQLTAAIQQVISDFQFVPGLYTILSAEDEQLSVMVRDFIVALEISLNENISIIFDDFQELVSENIHYIITQLINEAPPKIQILLATKDIIPPSLARYLINQTARIIHQEELCFSVEEIKSLIQELVPEDLVAPTATTIYDHVEGWPAAVMASYLYLERGLPGNHLDKITPVIYQNTTISDYLMHEVYRKLPFTLQQFLVYTAVLDFMDDDICNCVMGVDNTAHILDYLEQRNLFILRMQDPHHTTYRYHALFKQFLQSQISSEDRSRVLDIAANFYLRTDNREQAVEYAMANDNIPMMQYALESVGISMLEQSKLDTLERWLLYLQQKQAPITARNLLTKAAFAQRIGQPEVALADIDQAMTMFLSSMDENGYLSCMILKSQMARDGTSFADSCAILHSLLPYLTNKPVAAAYETYQELFFNYIFMGQYEEAHDICQSLLIRARAAGDQKTEARLQKFLAGINFGRGEYAQALQHYYDAVLAVTVPDHYSIRSWVACMELFRDNKELAKTMIDEEITSRLSLNKSNDLWLTYVMQALIYTLCAVDFRSAEETRRSDLQTARQAQRLALKYASFAKNNSFFLHYVQTVNQSLTAYLGNQFIFEEGKPAINEDLLKWEGLWEFVEGMIVLHSQVGHDSDIMGKGSAAEEIPAARSFFSAAALALYTLSLIEAGQHEKALACARDLFAYAARQDIRFLFTGFIPLQPLIQLAARENIEPFFVSQLLLVEKQQDSFAPYRLSVRCFGDFEVRLPGRQEPVKFRTKKAQEVFAYFIHLNNSGISKNKLLGLMWPDSTEKQATSLLHTTLYSIRKVLVDDLISYKNKKYSMDMTGIVSDLNGMWELCRAMENKDMKKVDENLHCLEIYQGPYLDNLEGEWSVNRKEYFERMYLKLRQYAATRELEAGRCDTAIQHLQKALEVDPLVESLHVLLMRCYHEAGNLSGIHSQYKKLTHLLAKELDVTPAPETCAAYSALTAH